MHRFLFPFKLHGSSLHVYTSVGSCLFSYNLSFITQWCSFASLPDTCKNCCQNRMMLLPVRIRFLVPRSCMTAIWFVISNIQLPCKDSPSSSADWKDSPFPSPIRRQCLRWNQIRCLHPRRASLSSEAPSYVIPGFTHRDAEAMVCWVFSLVVPLDMDIEMKWKKCRNAFLTGENKCNLNKNLRDGIFNPHVVQLVVWLNT